jgi:GNAT superfamily N-acetyltransferase
LSFCEQATQKAFLAVEDGRIIGYLTAYKKEQASCWQTKQVGKISGLRVNQNFRHQGIAARLLNDAEAFFISLDVRCYTTFTSTNNHGALDFYHQTGMRPLSITLVAELEHSYRQTIHQWTRQKGFSTHIYPDLTFRPIRSTLCPC